MKKRVWKRRRDGVRQRYWTGRKKKRYASRFFREEYLRDKVTIGGSKKERKVIGETLRRYPELLSKLETNVPVNINPSKYLAEGVTGNVRGNVSSKFDISLNDEMFKQSAPIKKRKIQTGPNTFEEVHVKGIKYNIPRTLAHEAEHVKQMKEDENLIEKYNNYIASRGYRDNPYEIEARIEAENLTKYGRKELNRFEDKIWDNRWDKKPGEDAEESFRRLFNEKN